MTQPFTARLIILTLLVSMLANTFGWSFNGKVFAHELSHLHHRELFLHYPDKHLELHQKLDGAINLDTTTHLCLHAAGQFQPFYLYLALPMIPTITGIVMMENVINVFQKLAPDPFFHPPRFF